MVLGNIYSSILETMTNLNRKNCWKAQQSYQKYQLLWCPGMTPTIFYLENTFFCHIYDEVKQPFLALHMEALDSCIFWNTAG